ncbi:MAG: LysR family transcriptional regulator [Clostridium sp.]
MFDGKEYVYAVYEEKSFSKAAQKLYITQPALSTAIKKVEKKIGSPIFDRSTSPIGLTPGGEVYIEAIEKLFSLEENTLNQLNNLNGLLAGKLAIGGTIFFTSFILPALLAEFSRKYPQIKIELVEGTTSQLTERLMGEEVDLIIDNSELDDKNYEKYYYGTERIILAVPRGFEINKELEAYQMTRADIANRCNSSPDIPTLPLSLLRNTPFIFLKEENSIYKRGAKMCSKQNYSPNVVLKPDQVVTAFNMAGKGVGATFIPDGLVANVPYDAPLCYYKMDEALSVRQVYLYKKRNKYLTKAMEEFIRVTAGDEGLKKAEAERKKLKDTKDRETKERLARDKRDRDRDRDRE